MQMCKYADVQIPFLPPCHFSSFLVEIDIIIFVIICTFAPSMELSEELQERVDIIRHKLKFIEQKPTVACVKQLDPLTLWAEQMPELVDIAGGASIATGNIQWEELEQQNPDIFIVMLEGLTVEQSMKEINQLLQLPGFTELKAVKNNRFYIADGNRYFDNSDASLVDYVELLAEIINPKQFVFGYEGEGWIKFNIT